MTREAILKNKEIFDAWLNGAEVQYLLAGNNNWVSFQNPEDPIWSINTKYKIKPKKIEFKDCTFNHKEFYVDMWAEVKPYVVSPWRVEDRKGFIKDKEIAEAYAVLPQLIRLVDEYNGGWKPNWKDGYDKYCINSHQNIISKYSSTYTNMILAFKTAEIRDKFLKDYRDLIEIAKPLL